jgi:hypothetical protein
MRMTFEGQTDLTEHRSRLSQWLDWWFEPRLRALITWIVLAFVPVLLLEDFQLNYLVYSASDFVIQTFGRYIGFSPSIVTVANVCYLAVFAWFQPLALRIGVLRGVAWIFVDCFLGTVAAYAAPGIAPILAFGHLCGIPGLLTIGVRTRPWMTFAGGAASILVAWAARSWGGFEPRSETVKYLILISNVPYAVVMLYGTSLISRRGNED